MATSTTTVPRTARTRMIALVLMLAVAASAGAASARRLGVEHPSRVNTELNSPVNGLALDKGPCRAFKHEWWCAVALPRAGSHPRS
jgi:hypothetical protein